MAFEQEKIKGAIRTDFILSAEIIVIALGIVANESLMIRISVLITIALLMTVAVYGLVAIIIKLDDFGLWLQQKKEAIFQTIGKVLLQTAPWLMRFLSIAGTVAMFLVGGGILAHGIPDLAHWLETNAQSISGGGFVSTIIEMLGNASIGIVAGGIALLGVISVKKIISSKKTDH